jgi:hypothetical protein
MGSLRKVSTGDTTLENNAHEPADLRLIHLDTPS